MTGALDSQLNTKIDALVQFMADTIHPGSEDTKVVKVVKQLFESYLTSSVILYVRTPQGEYEELPTEIVNELVGSLLQTWIMEYNSALDR